MALSRRDQKRIEKYYGDSLATYGPESAASVHWTDQLGQYTRFRVLVGIGNLNGQSILDVGCGTGEMYKFLHEEKIWPKYHGIDVVPELVEASRERFPEGDFAVADIFDLNPPGRARNGAQNSKTRNPGGYSFDFVFASGTLTFKVADNLRYYEMMIEKMWSLARKGLAFNMLRRDVHIDSDIYAAYDPKEIAGFCQNLPGGSVEIVIDYLPQDFTVYVRR